MQLQKTLTKFTTIIITLLVTVIPQTAQAGLDVSKITTYEALLDTFRAYPNNIEVKNECLHTMGYLKDSTKVPTVGHENTITTLISLGLHDSMVRKEAMWQIELFKLRIYEDTLFTLLEQGIPISGSALAAIGGHRTTEYFKGIIQQYKFDDYSRWTFIYLTSMEDSAFYLLDDIKKYRDSLGSYYHITAKCHDYPPAEDHFCEPLWQYYINTACYAVTHLQELMALRHYTGITIPDHKSSLSSQPGSQALINKSGSIYTPDGRLLRGPLVRNGVYIKDGKLIVNMETGK